jgi:sortase A
MKKVLPTIILICFFLIGLSLLLYPAVSNWWNSLHASQAIINYDEAREGLTEADYAALFRAAEQYNEEISQIDFPLMYHDQVAGYEQLLDVDGSGIMGYITISKIQVQLPIYHGTSEGVLQKGVGHLTGSSLPIGGVGHHAVLSAHRGLPSAKLFTDLDRMELGDRFTLTILNRELIYEIDQILTVKPQEVEALYPVEGEDHCTLITCTPYGVNSHRLLVRGQRVTAEAVPLVIPEDATLLPHYTAAPLLGLPFLLLWGLFTGLNMKRRKANEKISVDSGLDLDAGAACHGP